MATQTEISRALDDLKFVSDRFAGLVALGAQLKEVSVLLDQKDSLTKLVGDLSTQADALALEVKEKTDISADLDKETTDKSNALVKLLKEEEAALGKAEVRIEKMSTAQVAYAKKVKAEADQVLEDARVEAARTVKDAEAKVADAANRLSNIETEIDRLKRKF